jgi:hypothetical protein
MNRQNLLASFFCLAAAVFALVWACVNESWLIAVCAPSWGLYGSAWFWNKRFQVW